MNFKRNLVAHQKKKQKKKQKQKTNKKTNKQKKHTHTHPWRSLILVKLQGFTEAAIGGVLCQRLF